MVYFYTAAKLGIGERILSPTHLPYTYPPGGFRATNAYDLDLCGAGVGSDPDKRGSGVIWARV